MYLFVKKCYNLKKLVIILMNKNLKKILKHNYIAIILMIVVAVIQLLAYNGTRLINSQMKSFDLSIGFIDNNIPLNILPFFIDFGNFYNL